MRRVATFHCVIDTDDEDVALLWLNTVTQALDQIAIAATEVCGDHLTVVQPMQSSQEIPVLDAPPAARDDV